MPGKKGKKKKAAGNAAKTGDVFVRVCPPGKGGVKQAEIVRGKESLDRKPLKDFRHEIQEQLRDARPGAKIAVTFVDDPEPGTVTPKADAQVLIKKKHGKSGSNPGSGEKWAQSLVCVLASIGKDGNSLQFDPHPTNDQGQPHPLNVDSLKVTDRFLAARQGATFKSEDMALARFAPDVGQMGLDPEPNVDRNPYNFVPWIGCNPNEAQEPEHATHDRIADGRLSGRINITFTAQTPIFVPEGQLRENDDPNDSSNAVDSLDFFHCWNGSCERYAIPGASVKGAVRSLFEALTNSRAGVTDDSALGRVGKGEDGADRYCGPLYRRRATRLFKVVSMPHDGGDGRVQECKYVWYGKNGKPRRQSPGYNGQGKDVVTEWKWRANLFYVPGHCHGTRLDYYLDNQCFTLTQETLKQFKSMKGHLHLERHGGAKGNASLAQKKMYKHPVPDYSTIEDDLFALNKGDLIFGIPSGNHLRCFGKNVNFLWPGASSPLQMMGSGHSEDRGSFAAREPAKQRIEGSDPAEATFGFAGKHTGDSHPFRGRVRFGTFWGPSKTKPKPEDYLQLMPLTAPSGTKAKARPLYLEPLYLEPKSSGGLSANYDDHARLRGRKFYWHQRGKDEGNIPGVHDFGKLSDGMPVTWKQKIQCQLPDTKSQLPAKIRPLPVHSQFAGTLHFTNLTEAELGALLVSVKPDLAFGSESTAPAATDSPGYGIKLGKGKPRGLGSVTASIELELATPPSKRYRCLGAPLVKEGADTAQYVKAYKTWCMESTEPGGGKDKWEDLDMAKALKALLQIPQETSVRVYPPQFAMYGWLPKLDNPDGEPTSPMKKPPAPRPKAMTPAHKLKGP